MLTLWFFSGTLGFYLVPESKVIIDETGQLLPLAHDYRIDIKTVSELQPHLARVEVIIFAAEDKLFDAEFLAVIPPNIPKVMIIGDTTPSAVRQQINALRPDACLFEGVNKENFSATLEKACADKLTATKHQEDLEKYADLAFTAMKSAAEMGVVTLFAERAQAVSDISRLAKLCLSCLNDLNVDGIIQFSFDDECTVYPADAADTYKKLVRTARTAVSRITSSGRFLLYSFNHVQMLITNAPYQDEVSYGRLRDVLAPIVSVTEARLKTLRVNELLKKQQAKSKEVMALLEMASRDNRVAVKTIMTDLSLALRDMATGLELTLAQENALLSVSEDALESLEGLHESSRAIEEYFLHLLAQLDRAANLLDVPESNNDIPTKNDSMSIELF